MKSSRIRIARIAVAGLVFSLFLLTFADVFGAFPQSLKRCLAGTQFVPASVALFSGLVAGLVLVVLLVVTLLLGRIYCSAICPLGIWQDIVRRVAMLFKKKPLPARPPKQWLRGGIVALIGIFCVLGWGAAILSFFDPYSNFGRIGMQIFRPVVVGVNNLIVSGYELFELAGAPARMPFPWAGWGVFGFTLGAFLLVSAMAATRGRLFCNTICPVGTVLGALSIFAPFRVKMDAGKCVKCGACFRTCKAQCIDLKSGKVDATRCVACYDCVRVCEQGAISPTAKSKKAVTKETKVKTSEECLKKENFVENPGRRKFIEATAVGAGTLVAANFLTGTRLLAGTEMRKREGGHGSNRAPVPIPPGAQSLDRFLATCTGCQLCVSVCPAHVLEPALLEFGTLKGVFKPRLNFDKSFCNYECTRCTEVCPDGALLPLAKPEKKLVRLGHAVFKKERCIILRDGTACGACAEHCPTAALQIAAQEAGVPAYPKINKPVCIGCGACEYACPALPEKAIFVKPFSTHGVAKPLEQEQVEAPVPTDAFPF